jgi:hypothetical protein
VHRGAQQHTAARCVQQWRPPAGRQVYMQCRVKALLHTSGCSSAAASTSFQAQQHTAVRYAQQRRPPATCREGHGFSSSCSLRRASRCSAAHSSAVRAAVAATCSMHRAASTHPVYGRSHEVCCMEVVDASSAISALSAA